MILVLDHKIQGLIVQIYRDALPRVEWLFNMIKSLPFPKSLGFKSHKEVRGWTNNTLVGVTIADAIFTLSLICLLLLM
jgi:hypothetical protein